LTASRGAPSEEKLIARFLAPFTSNAARLRAPPVAGKAGSSAFERVTIGPGSDCAAVKVARGQQLVSTTDALVEGVHFDWRWFSGAQVGHKALAVNLSDLAAAGATPRWFLCALGIPSGQASRAAGIARGMARLAQLHGCALIGGNVSAANEWSITITALGEAPKPRSRIGVRPGDALVVCGQLGNAATGLRALRSGSGASPAALRAQRTPSPLIEAGLLARGLATAAIDVSDGFLRDLQRLCKASSVGAEVDCDALPIGRAATLEDALSGGEDYALLFSVPQRRLPALHEAVQCFEVGRFSREPGVRLIEHSRPRALPKSLGFDHLQPR
jgi:thiamine-monophosphate kinase